jgi:hypothetical protein
MPLPPLVRQLVDKKFARFCGREIPSYALGESIKLNYGIRGNAVTLFELRRYRLLPSETRRYKVAQFRYDPRDRTWTLYYVDRNEKWQEYFDILPTTKLDEVLQEVDEDPSGVFWGW